MEFADSKFLEAFLEAAGRPVRSGNPARRIGSRTALPSYHAPPRKANRHQRHQDCACAACLDNARWERIFQEKFADPTYYGGLPMRQASPLKSL